MGNPELNGKVVKQTKQNRGNPHPKAGPGRPKGIPNKITQNAREAIQTLLDNNADRVQAWLNQIAETDPKAALLAFTALLEFGVPKLQRTELTGKDGAEPTIAFRVIRD